MQKKISLLIPSLFLSLGISASTHITPLPTGEGEAANGDAGEGLRVLEYHPAPGQFVNTLPEFNEGDTYEELLQRCADQLNDGLLVHLGAYGGYITVALSQPVNNGKGSDLRILGNAFYSASDPKYGDKTIGGSIEPGIVYAGVGSSPETAEWYELAGSEYYTTEIHDYEITYYKPTAEEGEHSLPFYAYDKYIRWTARWTDKDGTPQTAEGWQPKNTFHTQSYWPLWETADKLTFRGGKLPDNAVNYGGDGTDDDNTPYWVQYRYASDSYGYADAAPNADNIYTTFDLDWAVDADGNPVSLDHADFIRIQTGLNQHCSWLGETSTEVGAITNLHLQPGYDDNPIVITPRKRPTSVNGITGNTRREQARYTIDGRRITAPVAGVNIIRYSDGTTRKVVVE